MEKPFLTRAVTRYLCFLELRRRNLGKFLVPTYDIDIVWHAHQLQPTYVADTTNLFGKMFNHDDSDTNRTPGGKLSTCADSTSKLWASSCVQPLQPPAASCHPQRDLHHRYEHQWAADGAMYRGKPPPPIPSTAPEAAQVLQSLAQFKAGFGCLCCTAPARASWRWVLQPGTFAPVPSVITMPGGEMVTATPVDGSADAKAARNLKAATHVLISANSSSSSTRVHPNPPPTSPFTIRVVHAQGAHLDASCVQASRARDSAPAPTMRAPPVTTSDRLRSHTR